MYLKDDLHLQLVGWHWMGARGPDWRWLRIQRKGYCGEMRFQCRCHIQILAISTCDWIRQRWIRWNVLSFDRIGGEVRVTCLCVLRGCCVFCVGLFFCEKWEMFFWRIRSTTGFRWNPMIGIITIAQSGKWLRRDSRGARFSFGGIEFDMLCDCPSALTESNNKKLACKYNVSVHLDTQVVVWGSTGVTGKVHL